MSDGTETYQMGYKQRWNSMSKGTQTYQMEQRQRRNNISVGTLTKEKISPSVGA